MICLEIILAQSTLKDGDFELICSILNRNQKGSMEKLDTFFSNIRIENCEMAVNLLRNIYNKFITKKIDIPKEKQIFGGIYYNSLMSCLKQFPEIIKTVPNSNTGPFNLLYIELNSFLGIEKINQLFIYHREHEQLMNLSVIFNSLMLYVKTEKGIPLLQTYLNTLNDIHTKLQEQRSITAEATAALAGILELSLPEKQLPESIRLIDIFYGIMPLFGMKYVHNPLLFINITRQILRHFYLSLKKIDPNHENESLVIIRETIELYFEPSVDSDAQNINMLIDKIIDSKLDDQYKRKLNHCLYFLREKKRQYDIFKNDQKRAFCGFSSSI